MSASDGFLSRWSRRKALAREGAPPADAPAAADAPTGPADAASVAGPAAAPPVAQRVEPDAPDGTPRADPPPTLDDVAALTRESHFGRFVQPDVDPAVKHAALKKLFADPQFNVMDGLDTYIDDYGRPDPLPAGMLRQMAQARLLGLFTDEEQLPHGDPNPANGETAAAASTHDDASPPPLAHEDTDLRLQPHDAARRDGAEPGAEPHRRGEC